MRDWMKLVVATGDIVLMDSEDVRLLNRLSVATSAGIKYAYTWTNKRRIQLSRFLMNPDDDFVVDHINGNRLDNRKDNLRICTNAENLRNRKRNVTNSCGYKGVYFAKGFHRNKPWRAEIVLDGKKIQSWILLYSPRRPRSI